MNPNVKKKKLIHTAVPTIFDIPNPPPRVTPKRPLPHRHSAEMCKKPKQDPIIVPPDEPIKGTLCKLFFMLNKCI